MNKERVVLVFIIWMLKYGVALGVTNTLCQKEEAVISVLPVSIGNIVSSLILEGKFEAARLELVACEKNDIKFEVPVLDVLQVELDLYEQLSKAPDGELFNYGPFYERYLLIGAKNRRYYRVLEATGSLLVMFKEYKKSLGFLLEAIKHHDSIVAYTNITIALVELGYFEEAIPYAEAALVLIGDKILILNMVFFEAAYAAFEKGGEEKKALQILEIMKEKEGRLHRKLK
jgi:tetratricopeptide (TPR) repeat protein